ncbi:zinc finger protein 608 isoform X2 [Lingula anatina]|uniref:Zinc finger protein 608 isoform X2 n=1 Tax=Lingula anatina TaxID=7574 RepID=A0A1S3HJK7_LINAN|nr:zinc finger protein 608 isoform X2 [Lingula anatina]|eukprot:XP_013385174.1 zinc finger protein 608 isoform X2 [Lingula anatina]
MKEKPGESPSGLTPKSSGRETRSSYSPVSSSGRNASLDYDEDDWEFGVGNLVIDLDADTNENKNTSSIRSPQKSPRMSSIEHQSTIDKGLKMKIKRKNVGSKLSESKHEIAENPKATAIASSTTTSSLQSSGSGDPFIVPTSIPFGTERGKMSPQDKNNKGRGSIKKEKSKDIKTKAAASATEPNNLNGNPFLPAGSTGCSTSDSATHNSTSETHMSVFNVKREMVHDPYEFNAKVEDGIEDFGLPTKKIKIEKPEGASCHSLSQQSSSHGQQRREVGTETFSVGISTEPECLGPCEPGTTVNLEGIVWQETENGMLVINVTWRGKTYVGTLLDATKHDWAPPRLGCDSPVSDVEVRTPKGRGKRGRTASSTPLNDSGSDRKLRKGRRGTNTSNSGFQAPPSPAKSDITPLGTGKRKGRPADLTLGSLDDLRVSKRSRSGSRSQEVPSSPVLIVCPEPNCNKKYKHINGLRYHQTHAHQTTAANINASNGSSSNGNSNSAVINETQKDVKEKRKEDKEANPKDEACSRDKAKDSNNPPATKPARKKGLKDSDMSDRDTPSVEGKGIKSSSSQKDIMKTETAAAESVETVIERSKSNSSPSAIVTPTTTVTAKTVTKDIVAVTSSSQSCIGNPLQCLGNMPLGPLERTVAAVPKQKSGVVTAQTKTTVVMTVPIPATIVSKAHMQVVSSTQSTVDSLTKDSESDKLVKKPKDSVKVGDRIKTKSSGRPIVPAHHPPSQQVIALSTNVAVTHSNLSPVTTATPHTALTQIGSALKPIQPKPTIMGEPTSINPVLASLKEKKMKHKKKVKEKEKDSSQSVIKDVPKDKLPKEGDGKGDVSEENKLPVNSSQKSKEQGEKKVPVAETEKSLPIVGDSASNEKERTVQPPSELNLSTSSPLTVNTDSRDPTGSNCQSPAYSDISDANDTAPTLENEKVKEDSKVDGSADSPSDAVTVQSQGAVHPYSMYPYYGQSAYMLPTLSPQPTGGSTLEGKSTPGDQDSKPVTKTADDKDRLKRKGESKEERKTDLNPEESQKLKDYQQRQMYQQQLYYANLPPQIQYQYMAYGYADPSLHMHLLATDPNYKAYHEQVMAEQERMKKEQLASEIQPKELGKDEASVQSGPRPERSDKERHVESRDRATSERERDRITSERRHSSSKHKTDSSQKTVLNDQQPVSKDKNDVKSLGDPARCHKMGEDQERRDSRYSAEGHRDKHFSTQHQQGDHKHYDEDKLRLSDKGKSDKRPPEAALGKAPQENSSKESSSPKDKTKEVVPHKEPRVTESMGSKKIGEKSKTGTEIRESPGAKSKQGDSVTSVSTTGPSSSPGPVSYGHYFSPYAPAPYGQIAYDPSHHYRVQGVYPAASPAYLYPNQMRYVSTVDGANKEKKELSSPSTPAVTQGKTVSNSESNSGHYYSPHHKIHELKEKAKPLPPGSPLEKTKEAGKRSETSSPSSSSEKRLGDREYTKSPPAQRHLHTHHHTHVVQGAPYLLDPYGAIMATHQAAAVHPFVPK